MADYATPNGPQPVFQQDVMSTLSTWAGNFKRNTTKAFDDLQPKDKIRLIIVVGAYFLLRPYLMKLGAWLQMRDFERQSAKLEEEAKASFNANDLRSTRIALPGLDPADEERDEDETIASATDWGRKAKIRQRAMIRRKLEEHEARLREMEETESDKEIAHLLED